MSERPARIMVVEDEVLIGLMLVRKLRAYGYEVGEVTTTGEEAVDRAGREKPDVILMDVTLAGRLNGIEASSIIKREYNIPIIIFSGYDDLTFQEQTRSIEPVAVLRKMDPVSTLVATIEQALQAN
jgi:CheY-like chemotaxis protein